MTQLQYDKLFPDITKLISAKGKKVETKEETEKDDFLEGFNDPYGEKEEKSNISKYLLGGRVIEQVAKPVWQKLKSSIIKTEKPKYTSPFVENSKNNGSEKELMFPNTELHAKPKDYGMMFPNTQLHSKPSENELEDDAFLKGFNDPYGENNTWEEQEENVNPFQRDMTGIAPMGRQKSMWCWIAAASMVDEYYHPEDSASQQEIADQLGKIEGEGGYIDEDSELGKGSRSCTTSGFSDRMPAKELTYEKIQKELHGKHPIVLLTNTGDDFKAEHYVVIVGCYTDGDGKRYVVVNETREKETMTGINGLQCHIPYEQIKGVFSTGRGADQKIKAFHTTRPEKDSQHK